MHLMSSKSLLSIILRFSYSVLWDRSMDTMRGIRCNPPIIS